MESFKHFGMLVIFLAYLLIQFNNTYAEGLAESNKEELEEILKVYPKNSVEPDQIPTRLSKIETGLARVKGSISKIKSWVPDKLSRIFRPSDNQKSPAKGGFSEFVKEYSGKIRAVFPGTRWCGDGNIAKNDDDLGLFKRTDACCRQHDKCPFNLKSGESLGPLKNNGAFTRSWCACDQDFYNCLKKANNPIAREIGMTYFTALGPQCIDYNYPVKCAKKTKSFSIFGQVCLDYEYDKSQKKVLQWKDSPNYADALNNKK